MQHRKSQAIAKSQITFVLKRSNDLKCDEMLASIPDTWGLYFLCVTRMRTVIQTLSLHREQIRCKRTWVLLCRMGGKKLLDASEISSKTTLQISHEWMQGGRISSKAVNSRDMWHSQHLSLLFGVQREISHPDSRQHLCFLVLWRETNLYCHEQCLN